MAPYPVVGLRYDLEGSLGSLVGIQALPDFMRESCGGSLGEKLHHVSQIRGLRRFEVSTMAGRISKTKEAKMPARKKILLVDHNVDFVQLTTTFLEEKGYQVIPAYDGHEGLKKARESRPNLIVLDVMMARLTEGFDVCREIKKDEKLKHIPVIVLSGIRKKEGVPWTFEPDEDYLPVTRLLEKPVAPTELLKEIENAVY